MKAAIAPIGEAVMNCAAFTRAAIAAVAIIVAPAPSLATEAVVAGSSSAWTHANSMSTGRTHHTATRLWNGKVLVAGGYTPNGDYGAWSQTASAEIFDPVTGTWSGTGRMMNSRAYHQAVLLNSGKVLVVGIGAKAGPNAEVYDPDTGIWVPAGKAADVPLGVSVTLLPSGKLLFAGGITSDVVRDAYLYDPGADTLTATGSLNVARYLHGAALLGDGRVLVAGGFDFTDGMDGRLTERAEVYDPATGAWSFTGDLVPAAYFPEATITALESGNVLTFASRYTAGTAVRSQSATYDFVRAAWAPDETAPRSGYYHSATLLSDGRVLIVGGGVTPADANFYDPRAATWRSAGSLADPRSGHTATLLSDGSVLVAGGEKPGFGTPMGSAEMLRPAPAPPGLTRVIEYYNEDLDHYFITALADEIAKLDDSRLAGWQRTGYQFNAYEAPVAGTSSVCRFYSVAFATSSHFYTPLHSECAKLRTDAHWMLESDALFHIALPSQDGACAAGVAPVYRLFNSGQGGAPNHRYTTDRNVRATMIAHGWVPEGLGPDAVQMCAP
jgi:N-acetylneuraminic acid mutarotase